MENRTTPEEVGISSVNIKKYIDALEEHQLSTHNVIMMRGENIFFEKYWEPFYPEFLHRMYSVTKSVVSLAIGFAEQDGLLELDDPIVKYFQKEVDESEYVDDFINANPWTQFADVSGHSDIPPSVVKHIIMRNCNCCCSCYFNVSKAEEQYQLSDFVFENLNIQTQYDGFSEGIIKNMSVTNVHVETI